MPENANPLTKERQALILARLRQDGRVLATELAVEFGISEDSVRRDLRQMAAAGLCERVYGGALPPAPPAAPLQDRILAMPDRTAMAVAMVGLIDEGDVVFIDAGSTNVAIAANMPASLSATIVTNAPAVASAGPADCPVRIVLIGGLLDRQSGACVGQATLRDLQNLRPDLLILGACGLDVDAGVTAFGYEEAEIKRLAASRSRRIAVAATVNKIGTAAP